MALFLIIALPTLIVGIGSIWAEWPAKVSPFEPLTAAQEAALRAALTKGLRR